MAFLLSLLVTTLLLICIGWNKDCELGEFPGGPVVRTQHFHCLVGELRSRKPCGMARKKKECE